jgi:hypothetical protein
MVSADRLRLANLKEKSRVLTTPRHSSIAITTTLHLMLWLSILSIVLAGFMVPKPVDGTLIPSAALMIISVRRHTSSPEFY